MNPILREIRPSTEPGAIHFDVLKPYVTDHGRGVLIASLHKITEEKPRGPVDIVEVRVNGQRVGQMTPGSSAHFLPLIAHLEAKGLVAGAWAQIKGSGLAAEVVLQSTKASEIDRGWLDGEPVIVPRLIPAAATYDVPNAYIATRDSGHGGPLGGSTISSSRTPARARAKPAAGCGMVAIGGVTTLALTFVPNVGPSIAIALLVGSLAWSSSGRIARAIRHRRQASA